MARPTTITDEQILAAARETFLERGISATTAEVAKRAGVAEGSIFNRFRTKAELFRKAMVPPGFEPEFVRWLQERGKHEDPKAVLAELGLKMVEFFRTLMPLIMMSWSNADACGLPEHLAVPNPPPVRALKALAGFFEREMRAGRMRRHDPEIVARVFIGSIQSYVFFEMLRAQEALPLPAETYVRGLVNLVWTGAEPRASRKG
jgi:AcrR family transcriptional regulator